MSYTSVSMLIVGSISMEDVIIELGISSDPLLLHIQASTRNPLLMK